jgi:hypothetical protein
MALSPAKFPHMPSPEVSEPGAAVIKQENIQPDEDSYDEAQNLVSQFSSISPLIAPSIHYLH